MAAATLTSKGQITIPVSVREALGLKTGDRVEFVPDGKDRFALVPTKGSVKALRGMFKKPDRPVTIEEMNQTIRERGSKA